MSNKQAGVVAGAASIIAAMAESQILVSGRPKGCVRFALDHWTHYDFVLNGETVRFTPEQMMQALKGEA